MRLRKKLHLSGNDLLPLLKRSIIPVIILILIVISTTAFILWHKPNNPDPAYQTIKQRVFIVSSLLIISSVIVSLAFTYLIARHRKTSEILSENRIRFSQLIETMDEGVMITDKKGKIIFVNNRLCDITGYNREEIVGKRFIDLTPVENRYRLFYKWKREISIGKATPKDAIVYKKTGEKLILAITPSLLLDAKGNFNGLIALARDITKQKALEKRLYEESQFFQVNPAVLLRTDSEGQVTLCNAVARSFFGKDPMGSSIQELVDVPIEENIKKLSPAESFQFEVTKAKTTIMFTVTRNQTGDSLYFYGSDITSLKEANREVLKFLQAVEQSESVIIITDTEERIIFVNRAMENYAGYKPEELIGKTPRIFKSGLVPQETYRELKETIRNGKTWEGELINKKKDGTLFWEHAIITPVIDNEGKIISFVAIKNDITKQKEIETKQKKAMEEAEKANRLKSIFLANMSHEIRTPMNAIIGYTELLLEEETNSEKRKYLEIIKQSGDTLLNLINDILDFSKIEADKMELNREPFSILRVIDHMKSMFKQKVEEKGLDFIINIEDNLPPLLYGDENRIGQIIINFLSNAIKFTDQGSITLSVKYRDNRLKISVKDTGIGISRENQEKIFSPFTQAPSPAKRHISGTGLGLAISKKLANLMGGEIYVKSSPGKGSTFTVEIPLQPYTKTDKVKLSEKPIHEIFISEKTSGLTGGNMIEKWLSKFDKEPEIKEILLNAIKKLPSMLKNLERAVSLNEIKTIQFIAHELKGMSGNLKMEEIYNITATINEEANKTSPDMKKINDLLFNLKNIIESIPIKYLKEETPKDTPRTISTTTPTILLAEDNPINRKLIEAILKRINLSCDIAEDGEQALEKILKNNYYLVLMDIQMPKLDGPQVLNRAKSQTDLKDTYIIALTAHAIKGDKEKYLSMGFDDYISKPIDIKQFTAKITSLLEKYQHKNPESQQTVTISSSNQERLKKIIETLEVNRKIFNPKTVLKIAEELRKMEGTSELQKISLSLSSAAESFDESALENIIETLKTFV